MSQDQSQNKDSLIQPQHLLLQSLSVAWVLTKILGFSNYSAATKNYKEQWKILRQNIESKDFRQILLQL